MVRLNEQQSEFMWSNYQEVRNESLAVVRRLCERASAIEAMASQLEMQCMPLVARKLLAQKQAV